jgi:hypothetical protein
MDAWLYRYFNYKQLQIASKTLEPITGFYCYINEVAKVSFFCMEMNTQREKSALADKLIWVKSQK